VFQYIISAVCRCFSVSQMRAVDLANMLREVLDAKINQTRRKTLDTYMPIEVEWLEARIWTSYQQQK
jgi:hypothetical protein